LGRQVGIVPIKSAMNMAKEMGLDLVEVASNPEIPVAKIMDYGKYLYEQNKKVKKQKTKDIKEIKLRPGIKDYDLNVKVEQSKKFLAEDRKIRTILTFRGREILHKEMGMDVVMKFSDLLRDFSVVETRPSYEGNRIIMVIAPKKT